MEDAVERSNALVTVARVHCSRVERHRSTRFAHLRVRLVETQ
jgi:hypothetical protein